MTENMLYSALLSTEEGSEQQLKTLCFTGHRFPTGRDGEENMKRFVDFALQIGYRTFLSGMAMGFDSLAFDYVYSLKKKYKDIRLVACVPCLGQEKNFPKAEQSAYRKRLERADLTVILSERYTEGCMHQRNRFMVDRSSCVISYMREQRGGTAYTVKYAEERGKQILSA